MQLPKTSHILLVEDSAADATLLQRTLRKAGVTNPIHHVWNGADAIGFLNINERASQNGDSTPLGVVLIDLKLPDKSGLDILKLLRGRKAFADTTRIVISQIEYMEHIKQAYALGADSFIAKPITEIEVAELLHAFPENWRLTDELEPNPSTNCLSISPSESNPSSDAAYVWAKNREIIQTLRTNLETLGTQLSDNEETFVIIETLTEELRGKYAPLQSRPLPNRSKPQFGK